MVYFHLIPKVIFNYTAYLIDSVLVIKIFRVLMQILYGPHTIPSLFSILITGIPIIDFPSEPG